MPGTWSALISVFRTRVMKNKILTVASVMIIIAFVVFIIIDFSFSSGEREETTEPDAIILPEERWQVSEVYDCREGSLKAVAVSPKGDIFVGGESFITCLEPGLFQKWSIKTEEPVTALSVSDQILYATTKETILLVSLEGKITGEWGPYESNSLITSVSSNNEYVAFADASNKRIFILKKDGEVVHMIGHTGQKFIIPSPYFDVVLTGNNILYAANTGMHRVEEWTVDGKMTDTFGVAGLAPDAFCGCCNPAHITAYGDGLITAEKGINRIKTIDGDGEFVELVSSVNDFVPSVPLDLAANGDKIYGANPADSRLYVFEKR